MENEMENRVTQGLYRGYRRMYRGMAKNMETAVISGFYGTYFVGPGVTNGLDTL